MNISDILTLFDYNYWAIGRILDASTHVSTEQFLAPTTHSFSSLRGTLVHILDTECGWRMLCQHQTLTSFDKLKQEDFPSFGELAQTWNVEEHAMRDYLAHLNDNDLTRSHLKNPFVEG